MPAYFKYLAASLRSRILGGETVLDVTVTQVHGKFVLTSVNKIILAKPQHVLFVMPIFKQSSKSLFLPRFMSLSYPAEKIFFCARWLSLQGITASWFCALKGIAPRPTVICFL